MLWRRLSELLCQGLSSVTIIGDNGRVYTTQEFAKTNDNKDHGERSAVNVVAGGAVK
jgi:hypothetical protein